MLKAIRDTKIGELTGKKNFLTIALGASLITNMILSIGIKSLVGSERIVLLWPTGSEDIWVTPQKTSSNYLKEISQYILLSTLNVTPQTAATRREVLLAYVHPSGYGQIKNQLLEEEGIIKKKNVTKMFTPIGFEIDDKALKVKAIGELTTWVSKEKISQDKTTYILQYKMNAGKLQLVEFKEEQHEKNS